jgi:hypothetical protein
MASESLLPLLDALLRLPRLESSELHSLLQQIGGENSDPQAMAQELLRRGLISPAQVASLTPPAPEPVIEQPAAGEQPPPAEQAGPRETILVGFGDDDAPLDLDAASHDEWSLPTDDELTSSSTPPQSESLPAASPSTSEPTVPAPAEVKSEEFGWEALASGPAVSQPASREDPTDRRLRQVLVWSGKGLLVWSLFLGSFFFGVWFLRPASQSQLSANTRQGNSKSRDQTGKRWWQSKELEGSTALAREELIAAENSDLARSAALRAAASTTVAVPQAQGNNPGAIAWGDGRPAPVNDNAAPQFPAQLPDPGGFANTSPVPVDVGPGQMDFGTGMGIPVLIPIQNQGRSFPGGFGATPVGSRGATQGNQPSRTVPSTVTTKSSNSPTTSSSLQPMTSGSAPARTSSSSRPSAGTTSSPSHSRTNTASSSASGHMPTRPASVGRGR